MWLGIPVFIASLLAACSLVLCTVLLRQVFAALRFRPGDSGGGERAASVAVLVPAHNEEAAIAATVHAVLSQLRTGDRLLVIADNCTDGTKRAAEAAGADVSVRSDTTRRGKGYALDYGIGELNLAPKDVLIVIDADCMPALGCIDELATQCMRTGLPAQGLYLMHPPEGSGVGLHIAAFAWRVRNQVRAMGSAALGWPCQVMGAGFAMPWPLVARADLASGNIVEDMRLGVDLVLAGVPTRFCVAARIDSSFPASDRAQATQRRRWEHGHLATITLACPRLVLAAIRAEGTGALPMALDLAVPPLALLAATTTAGLLLSGAVLLAGGTSVPLILSAIAITFLACAVLVAWSRWGRDLLTARDLLSIPLYVLGKLPVYLGFLRKRETSWIRTERD